MFFQPCVIVRSRAVYAFSFKVSLCRCVRLTDCLMSLTKCKFLMSPLCLESQGCQFDLTFLFYYLLLFFCLVLTLYLIPFCFWPILLTIVPKPPFSEMKGSLFCVAHLFSGIALVKMANNVRRCWCH